MINNNQILQLPNDLVFIKYDHLLYLPKHILFIIIVTGYINNYLIYHFDHNTDILKKYIFKNYIFKKKLLVRNYKTNNKLIISVIEIVKFMCFI